MNCDSHPEESVRYECPWCGRIGEIPYDARWKIIRCGNCHTTLLNEDIWGFDP